MFNHTGVEIIVSNEVTTTKTDPTVCNGKKGYSRDAAKIALQVMRRKYPNQAFSMYRCPECHMWHVGHDRRTRSANYDHVLKKKRREHRGFKYAKTFNDTRE